MLKRCKSSVGQPGGSEDLRWVRNGRRVTDACEPVQDPGLARRTFSCGPDRIVIDACEKNANPGFDNLVDRSTFGPKG